MFKPLKVTTSMINGVAVNHTFHINEPLSVIPDVLGGEKVDVEVCARKVQLVNNIITSMLYINDLGGYTAASERQLLKSFLGEIYGSVWTQEMRDADQFPDPEVFLQEEVRNNIKDMATRLLSIVTTAKIMKEFHASHDAVNVGDLDSTTVGDSEGHNFRGLIRIYYLPKVAEENPKQKRSTRYAQLGKFIPWFFLEQLHQIQQDRDTEQEVTNEVREQVKPEQAVAPTFPADQGAYIQGFERFAERVRIAPTPRADSQNLHPYEFERKLSGGFASQSELLAYQLGKKAALEELMGRALLPELARINGTVNPSISSPFTFGRERKESGQHFKPAFQKNRY